MPRTTTRPSLLSSAPGHLVLRVRGTARDGQVIRLRSAKCTIGSGPNCTLRLRADGVEPVHCLLLRGPGRTIVRRWSADTRLNGRSFTDSILQPGDQLSIGRLDLEVVDTGHPEAPAENQLTQQPSVDDQLAEIEARLRSLDEQQTECKTRQADLAALQASWEDRQAELRQQWEARERQLEAAGVELEASRDGFDEQCRQWEASQSAWNARRAAEAEQSAARQAELDEAWESFESQRTAWQTETAAQEEQVSDAKAESDRLRTEIEAAQAALAEERRRWETQRADTSGWHATASEQLAAQEAEIEAARCAFDEQKAAWRADDAKQREQLAVANAELDRLRAECELDQLALAEERDRWELQRSEENNSATEQIALWETELDVARQAFGEQKTAWQAQTASVEQALNERLAGLDALQVDLQSQLAALENERRQWETKGNEAAASQAEATRELAARQSEIDAEFRNLEESRAEIENQQRDAERRLDERAAQLDQLNKELEARQREMDEARALVPAVHAEPVPTTSPENGQSIASADDSLLSEVSMPCDSDIGDDETASAEHEVPAEDPPAPAAVETPVPKAKAEPVSLAEILRRTGFAIDEDAASGDRADNHKAVEKATAIDPANITSPAPRTRKPVQGEHEEESINDYMARLLARSRGDSVTPSTQAAAEAEKPSAADAAAPQPMTETVPAAAAPLPVKPIEMAPRIVPPEKGIDMKAMRQLANLSANTAISKHENKQLDTVSRTKLAVSVAAGFAGTLLSGLSVMGGVHLTTMVLATASFAVAAYWGNSYVLLSKQAMGAQLAHMERHLKATDETSGDKSASGQEGVMVVPSQADRETM